MSIKNSNISIKKSISDKDINIINRLRLIIKEISNDIASRFASKIGVSRGYLGNILAEQQGVSATIYENLANIGISIDWLITGQGHMFLPGYGPKGKIEEQNPISFDNTIEEDDPPTRPCPEYFELIRGDGPGEDRVNIFINNSKVPLLSEEGKVDRFSWGYVGTGPFNLSREILKYFLGKKKIGKFYEGFRNEILDFCPTEPFKTEILTKNEIEFWVLNRKHKPFIYPYSLKEIDPNRDYFEFRLPQIRKEISKSKTQSQINLNISTNKIFFQIDEEEEMESPVTDEEMALVIAEGKEKKRQLDMFKAIHDQNLRIGTLEQLVKNLIEEVKIKRA